MKKGQRKVRIKRMELYQGVIIFLAAALIVFVGTTVYLSYRCKTAQEKYEDISWRLQLSNDDRKDVLDEYIKLLEDNEKLLAANKELIAINKELMNAEKVRIDEAEREETPAPEKQMLPEGHTNTFRCEPIQMFDKYDDNDEPIYKSTFHPKSDQYKLQEGCTTDITTGIRLFSVFTGTNRYEKYYCAAMATAYGTEIGRAYKIKLKCGTEFNVILADFKHPIDNIHDDDYGDNDTNYDGEQCTNVIEFVVDMDSVPDKVKQAGTMSALAQFGGLYGDGGDIISIEYIGKVW
jgi:hypothetical protein